MAAGIAVQRAPWEAQQLMREELSTILSNRSASYYEAGDYIGSLVDAEIVIQIRRPWSKGHFRKAKALKELDKLDEAKEAIELGLSYEPGNAVSRPSCLLDSCRHSIIFTGNAKDAHRHRSFDQVTRRSARRCSSRKSRGGSHYSFFIMMYSSFRSFARTDKGMYYLLHYVYEPDCTDIYIQAFQASLYTLRHIDERIIQRVNLIAAVSSQSPSPLHTLVV